MTARVLFACGREPTYIRNQLLIESLRESFDVDVIASGRGTYLQRLAYVLPQVARLSRKADVMVAGFLGQPVVAAALATRKPIVLDAFISLYDTLCLDRRMAGPRSPVGRLAYFFDQRAAQRSRRVLVDTRCQQQFFFSTFGISESKVSVHYLGPSWKDVVEHPPDDPHTGVALHYGSFLPLHGTEVVVKAAEILRRDRRVEFRLIGRGPRLQTTTSLSERLRLPNVRFVDWLPPADLYREVAGATIGLGGHFAENPKARRVIAGKTFQFLAAGRPTIVGDCPANHELFTGGQNVEFVEMNNPEDLARQIARLCDRRDQRESLGRAGQALMRDLFAPENLARALRHDIERAMGESAA